MCEISVLLTNDDGITSSGLTSLVSHLKLDSRFGITVVAPSHPQSAQSYSHAHGDRWIPWNRSFKGDKIPWISVDGSPATCISVAFRELRIKPDIVISGINNGENLGLNLFYSGTVGAAWEAAMSGSLALAVSLELPANLHYQLNDDIDFNAAAFLTKKTIYHLLDENPKSKLWNLNFPSNVSESTIIKQAQIASNRWNYPIVRERKRLENSGEVRFEFDPTGKKFDSNSDVFLLRKGYATLTAINQLKLPWS